MANQAIPASALRVRGLDHLLLMVDDMERAIAFYQGVLGCSVKERLSEYGMAELAVGDQGLDLVDVSTHEGAWARPSVSGGGNLHHFCLAVDVGDEAQLRAHLAAHTVKVVEERLESGYLSLYVLDPSGNQVELRFRSRG